MNSRKMWKKGQLLKAVLKRKGFPIRRVANQRPMIALVLEDQDQDSEFVRVLLNDKGNVRVTMMSPFSSLVEVKILNNV
jgi:hypothetical protein